MEEVKVAAAKEAAEAESRGTESLVPTLPQAETSVPGRRANPSPNPNPNPNPTPYPLTLNPNPNPNPAPQP
jgi:hypothetical protein